MNKRIRKKVAQREAKRTARLIARIARGGFPLSLREFLGVDVEGFPLREPPAQ